MSYFGCSDFAFFANFRADLSNFKIVLNSIFSILQNSCLINKFSLAAEMEEFESEELEIDLAQSSGKFNYLTYNIIIG